MEELAGIDVLCSDKTGTLTQNKLTMGDPFSVGGVRPEEVVLAASLASRAENQDPIDLAVLSGLKDPHALDDYQVTHFQSFDPVHKRTESTVKGPESIVRNPPPKFAAAGMPSFTLSSGSKLADTQGDGSAQALGLGRHTRPNNLGNSY
jgi:P-type E1-E2 ATPase